MEAPRGEARRAGAGASVAEMERNEHWVRDHTRKAREKETLRFLVYTTGWSIEPFTKIRNAGKETRIFAFFSLSLVVLWRIYFSTCKVGGVFENPDRRSQVGS